MLEFTCGLYQCLLRFIYRPHLKCSLWNDAHITDYSEVVDQVVLTHAVISPGPFPSLSLLDPATRNQAESMVAQRFDKDG